MHHFAPASLGRDEELVLVGVHFRGVSRHALLERPLDFLAEAVGEPLEEEHREDVVLVVAGVDLAAQDVGGAPEFRLKLGCAQRH